MARLYRGNAANCTCGNSQHGWQPRQCFIIRAFDVMRSALERLYRRRRPRVTTPKIVYDSRKHDCGNLPQRRHQTQRLARFDGERSPRDVGQEQKSSLVYRPLARRENDGHKGHLNPRCPVAGRHGPLACPQWIHRHAQGFTCLHSSPRKGRTRPTKWNPRGVKK